MYHFSIEADDVRLDCDRRMICLGVACVSFSLHAEVVHELSSCLARTAEQQQLLIDAARLLTRGEVTILAYLR